MKNIDIKKIKKDFYNINIQKRIKNKELYLIPDYIPEWADIYSFNRVTSIIQENKNHLDSGDKIISSLTYEDYMKIPENKRKGILLDANGLIWCEGKIGKNISIPFKLDGKRYIVHQIFNHLLISDTSENHNDLDTIIINDDGTTKKLDDIYSPDVDEETFEMASNIYKSIPDFRRIFIN